MRQLIRSYCSLDDKIIILALQDQVLVGSLNIIHNAEEGSHNNNTPIIITIDPPVSPEDNDDDPKLLEVTAVAITKIKDQYWVAVSRCNKTLCLYTVNFSQKTCQLTHSWNSPKRVNSLVFQWIDNDLLPILVTADFGGDVFAFDLHSPKQRLMLGHTAGMLTGLEFGPDSIMTADRDEKVRISSFPDTHIIRGFLLGHRAFVSSISLSKTKGNLRLVITCGGDRTMRLWNSDSYEQVGIYKWPESSTYPTKVTINSDATKVSVIFDLSSQLETFEIKKEGEQYTFVLVSEIELPSNTLDLCRIDDNVIAILCREPTYLSLFDTSEMKIVPSQLGTTIQSSWKTSMPSSILERDNFGNIKLEKRSEDRSSTTNDRPTWNDAKRIELAKERGKRARQRRAKRKLEGGDDS